MAKMRVHELAKELNIKSQDVIDTLNGTQFAVKNVQSGLEDEAQKIVRKKYTKAEEKKETDKKEEPKKDDAKAADRPKKKASITTVFNAQYSKQGRKTNGGNGNGKGANGGSERRNGNGRRDNQSSRPEQHSIIKPRPVGERAMRPISERTADPYADMKPANSRPARQADADRRGDRRQDNGDRINNRNTDRNTDRSRNTDRNSDRRPNNRDNNLDNNRGFRNDSRRPAEGGRSFDRNNDRTGGRGDDRNRFRKETVAVAAPDDVRGKESRDRGNDRKNKHNHNQSQKQDKLGKKQENYINLEKHGGKKKPQQPKAQPKEDENEFTIKRVGTWIGKTGRIDIVAQSEDRRSIIGFCNWDKPMMTMDMCENMAMAMEQARLTSDDYYLFSATDFEPALKNYVVRDPRFKLINMNEL